MTADTLTRADLARASHPDCIVCGGDDSLRLGLEYRVEEDGSLCVTADDLSGFPGYPNRLHGGIISTLFDAAMTHCLFAHKIVGVTASLNVQFHKAVIPTLPVVVRVSIEQKKCRLFRLRGSLYQEDEVRSTAEARFWAL